ncbi:MAG: DUF2059 domain-containing protein [Pseudomonadota bacterium]
MASNAVRIALAMVAGLFISLSAASAQEISESHMAAARKALASTNATKPYDQILFNQSAQLKNNLTAQAPNLTDEISVIVDEEAIAIAPRRADLENEAAKLFANTFTEAELGQISDFFSSDAGSKYLDATPILARELGRVARIWANGITRDMGIKVQERVSALTPAEAAPAPTE